MQDIWHSTFSWKLCKNLYHRT